MNGIQRKDATISPVGPADAFPGEFEVILSAPTKDRDGDTLMPEDWKRPLPEHITFDQDHGMNVASTVGSGAPSIDPATGNLVVRGTYSSLPRAQEVRTLVNEGHIRTTSVAFMTESVPDDKGGTKTVRELLNGAFVAVPSNREALVLSSKSAKAGARNSASDMEHIQAIHDHALALGATPAKAAKGFVTKDADNDPTALVQAIDAALDEATTLLSQVDPATLPEPVAQAIGLVTAAETAVDELMEVVGIYDADDDDDQEDASAAAPVLRTAPTPAPATAAPDGGTAPQAAPEDAELHALADTIAVQSMSLALSVTD